MMKARCNEMRRKLDDNACCPPPDDELVTITRCSQRITMSTARYCPCRSAARPLGYRSECQSGTLFSFWDLWPSRGRLATRLGRSRLRREHRLPSLLSSRPPAQRSRRVARGHRKRSTPCVGTSCLSCGGGNEGEAQASSTPKGTVQGTSFGSDGRKQRVTIREEMKEREIHKWICGIARAAAEVARWRPRSWAMDGAHERVLTTAGGNQGGGGQETDHTCAWSDPARKTRRS